MRAFLRLLLFVGLGPVVGLFGVALGLGFYTLIATGSPRDFAFGPDLFSPGVMLVTYTIGTVPALLTGIVAIFVARRSSGWANWLWMALVGAVISFAGGFVLVGGGPEMLGVGQQMPLMAWVGLAGAIAAFVCAALFEGLTALLRRGG